MMYTSQSFLWHIAYHTIFFTHSQLSTGNYVIHHIKHFEKIGKRSSFCGLSWPRYYVKFVYGLVTKVINNKIRSYHDTELRD